jgi:hypothetical protein
MVTTIRGTAIVPDFYIADNGVVVKVRPEDMYNAVANSDVVTYVDKHIENTTDDIKGIATSLEPSDYGIAFDIAITDSELENIVVEKYENGEVPNVSAKLLPMPDAAYTQHMTPDGNMFVTCDNWYLKHISNVDVGRCKPEDGCGVWNYTMTLEDKTPTYEYNNDIHITEMNGDNMTEEPCIKTELAEAKAEVESLSLKLSELKETNSELEGQIAELRKEKEGMELVLSETKENLEILAKREYDEEVDLILSLDSEYPLKGDETMDELELILTALRRSSERRKSLVGDKNKEDMTATSVVNELKELTGRIR